MSHDNEITEREERVKEIISRLDEEGLSLSEAKELRDEAYDHLEVLRSLTMDDTGTR